MSFYTAFAPPFSSFLTSPFPRTCARSGRVNASLSLSLLPSRLFFFSHAFEVIDFLVYWLKRVKVLAMASLFAIEGARGDNDDVVLIVSYLYYLLHCVFVFLV